MIARRRRRRRIDPVDLVFLGIVGTLFGVLIADASQLAAVVIIGVSLAAGVFAIFKAAGS